MYPIVSMTLAWSAIGLDRATRASRPGFGTRSLRARDLPVDHIDLAEERVAKRIPVFGARDVEQQIAGRAEAPAVSSEARMLTPYWPPGVGVLRAGVDLGRSVSSRRPRGRVSRGGAG